MNERFQPWDVAWHHALYGPDGFYRRCEGPAGHFATSVQGIPGVDVALANTVLGLAESCRAEVIVDFACGRGELLTSIHRLLAEAERAGTTSDSPALMGVDVVARPDEVPQDCEWVTSSGGGCVPALPLAGRRALVIAHEWLDVVPTPVAEADADGTWRQVLVAADGEESVGSPLAGDELTWAQRYRPEPLPGERLEIGLPREAAWRALLHEVKRSAAPGSLVVGVDYAFTRDRVPPLGTLTGFAGGSQTSPIPDGSCDLTSHVAVDGLDVDSFTTQRDLLFEMFGSQPLEVVPIELARTNPPEYLARLSARSAFTTATNPDGLGRFVWWFRELAD